MKVKLLTPHTHAGKDYKAGDEIDVDETTTVEFLRTHGIIAAAPHKTPINEKK